MIDKQELLRDCILNHIDEVYVHSNHGYVDNPTSNYYMTEEGDVHYDSATFDDMELDGAELFVKLDNYANESASDQLMAIATQLKELGY